MPDVNEYKLTPVSFNGHALEGGNLSCSFYIAAPGPGVTRRIEPREAVNVGRGSRHVGSQPRPSWWEVRIEISKTREEDKDEVYAIFDEEATRDDLALFVARGGDGVLWQTAVKCVETQRVSGTRHLFLAVLWNPTGLWLSADEIEVNEVITDGS